MERADRVNGERAPIDIEQYPEIPIATFAQRAVDALYLAIFGRTFEGELRHRLAQANAAAPVSKDGNPVQAAAE